MLSSSLTATANAESRINRGINVSILCSPILFALLPAFPAFTGDWKCIVGDDGEEEENCCGYVRGPCSGMVQWVVVVAVVGRTPRILWQVV